MQSYPKMFHEVFDAPEMGRRVEYTLLGIVAFAITAIIVSGVATLFMG